MYNLFLTGKIECGNTTLIKNLIERINTSVGGFMESQRLEFQKEFHKILDSTGIILGVLKKYDNDF